MLRSAIFLTNITPSHYVRDVFNILTVTEVLSSFSNVLMRLVFSARTVSPAVYTSVVVSPGWMPGAHQSHSVN